MLKYFHDTKVAFKTFLERPDRKQALLELFQKEFNAVEDDLRLVFWHMMFVSETEILVWLTDVCLKSSSDSDAKSELHQRVEDLRDQLWELSDTRKDEAEQERLAIIEDRWVEDHFAILTNVYVTAMQAEVDRYVGTKAVVVDYWRDVCGAVSCAVRILTSLFTFDFQCKLFTHLL